MGFKMGGKGETKVVRLGGGGEEVDEPEVAARAEAAFKQAITAAGGKLSLVGDEEADDA